MRNKVYAAAFLTSAIFLAGCEGDDGVDGIDGSDGSDGFNSLIAIREIPKGDAECLGGGTAVDSGLDTNRNDVLDESEVTSTTIVECEATPTVRALHASPDAPAVNIWVNGAEALSGVDYGQGSGFLPVAEENNIQVEAIIPGGNAVVIDADVALDYSTETTVIALDTVADNAIPGSIRPLAIMNPSDERLAPGYFRAQVVHAAPSAPPVDVYVTEFDADLNGSMPVNGAMTPLGFEEYTERLERPAGDYQIRITLGDDVDTVVYDSGEIPLADGADLMIVAIDNTGPGESPVKLVVLDGTASAMLYDASTPASIVAAHLSPDAPAVDLLADVNDTAEDEALPLVRNVAYNQFCDLNGIPAPGDYTVSVVANADNSIVAHTIPVNVMKGDEALAIVSGFLAAGDPAITDITLPGNSRSVATEAKLRITHASPSTAEVDLYLVGDGVDINTVEPNFANVPFGGDTMQLSVAPGDYDAYVTPTGSKTPAISLTELSFSGGEVLDVIARDPVDGETLPQPVVIDYSSVAACPAP
ncbi:MAG: DUF4397 domain-containing protein [Woeseiaceae bacterium]|jgi:hypothetical protein